MDNRILGLHHITAIADNAKRNLDFYTKVLGVRLVKKTVNFDDPGTYHFYFGNEEGTPGTILTFFPWEGIGKGTNGSGMATHIGYSVPKGSLEFWRNHLQSLNVAIEEGEIFGEKMISFKDPDGLQLQLIEPLSKDNRKVWTTDDIKDENALRGFHNVTLTLRKADPTIKVLTDILGYDLQKQEGERYRLATDAIDTANLVDIIENDKIPAGRNAAGTNHHIAFRVKDDNVLMEYREKALSAGLSITPKINRDYFYSLYFREPGGVLFEIATDNPGFTVDEPLNELGTNLKLPVQYEGMREKIEGVLPNLS
ncbi:glyoxalase family protein [Chryseobacterium bernardetii]|uniref:Glyoxalase family protein n=2 Tax=Chryseobacterium TaxID=59732 RepID=A0A543ELI4_9FLAO|nr:MULTISPECIES: ring-cleaving dioxygenase [Chryseobacterium]MDR6368830.1 glyoxalase family protein [Chryseobacterium vietnamense]MDR6440247.1 glyoxalase family protein [Chryseobacterium bernardetii]MDR6489088.1 glyoxalase family protein [Chryseobacterium vietnamense]TQM22441.1 glyoxalase family protein [Chryseobacterium aquifrigidense]